MARAFVADYLVPLVAGGAMEIGAPLGPRGFARLAERWTPAGADDGTSTALVRRRGAAMADEVLAAGVLAEERALVASALVPGLGTPPLDSDSLRLAVSLHNVLSLSHPALQRTEGQSARVRERTLAFTTELAQMGPPATLRDAIFRHTLLGRVGEIVRPEHTVEFWLGRRTFIGTAPPRRLLAWRSLRRVEVQSGERKWLSEIGVPVAARPLWETLQDASPLGEALDPLRLDPAPSWRRLPTVLRFAPLARLVAGRVLALGLASAGEALVVGFIRHASLRATADADAQRGENADAIRFFAHLLWLAQLSGGRAEPGPAMAALLLTAAELAPALVLPPDVPRDGAPGAAFLRRLQGLRARADGQDSQYGKISRALVQDLLVGWPARARAAAPSISA